MKRPEIDVLLDDELTALEAAAAESFSRDWMIVSLALKTGLRNAELCKLTIECFRPLDEIIGILDVPGTIAKGGHPRQIPLHPDLRVSLQNFLTWKHNRGESIEGTANVFLTKHTHKQMMPRDIQRIIKSLSEASIGRAICPHTLRHTFATRLLSVSNIRIVQKALGHKSIASTQIYTHPSNEEISQAINQM